MSHLEKIREHGYAAFGVERHCGDCKMTRLVMINPRIDDEGTFYIVVEEHEIDALIVCLQGIRDDITP